MFHKFRGEKGIAVLMMAGLICWLLEPHAGAAAIAIVSPSNGATVSGMVTVTLSPGSGTSWSDVYVDGIYQNSTPPNVFYWQTTGVANGSHTVSATAFGQNGSSLGSASSTVTVANSGAVSLTSPANGATVSGPVTIGLTIGPSTSWANIYINGVYESSTPPNSFNWQTTAMPNGQYQVSATAFGSNGNNLGSSQLTVTVNNGATPAAPSNSVSISAPAGGSTVSGTVDIVAAAASGVSWINFYVDGNYLNSSPPLSYSWNSGTVANGNHTLSITAFNSAGSSMGSASSVINVQNASVTPTTYFSTLPPGSTLPSGAACAAAVPRNPNFEPRPGNYTANNTVPSSADLALMRSTANNGGVPAGTYNLVDGNFTGTTDEILQWGACKWGFDENLVRAIADNESGWYQSGAGDLTYDLSLCPAGAVYDGGECALSYGIMQVKSTDYTGTFPYSHTSTALDVDYKLAYQRACFEGKIAYLGELSPNYPNGDENNMLWGCVDQWYSGGWWDGTNDLYLNQVQSIIAAQPWLLSGF
jgi:autotransporter family porin